MSDGFIDLRRSVHIETCQWSLGGRIQEGMLPSFCVEKGLARVTFPGVDEAVAALTRGDIDAIVADTMVLDYFSHTRPQQDVSVVGEIFAPEKYGFGIARNSRLRRPLTVELLGAEEAGVIEELRTKYFGTR